MTEISREYREYIARQLPELSAGLVDCLESTDPVVSVRLNPAKTAPGMYPPVCNGSSGSVAWWSGGLYLPERPDFTHDPAMHQGAYYVQDASSMIIARVVQHISAQLGGVPLLYLDACAAPGGKTTAAIDALPAGSAVVANEFDFRRAEILRENVQKWGYPDVAVSRGDTARFRRLPMMFDIVAADVPCSGEGMMRKDAEARAQWSPRLVAECAARQWEIVQNLWEALTPGGYFIYSTCTFNTEENEQIIDRVIHEYGAECVDVPLPDKCGICRCKPGQMRFFPNRLQGEGLFMAVLRKPGNRVAQLYAASDIPEPKRRKKIPERNTKGQKTLFTGDELKKRCGGWLTGDFDFILAGDTVYAQLRTYRRLYDTLGRELDLILPGVEVARIKGRDLMPVQGLALSSALNPTAFTHVEVDLPTAVSYLRHEALPGFDAPNGPLLLYYGGELAGSTDDAILPLGFVNNLGKRANNLYPANWRILH